MKFIQISLLSLILCIAGTGLAFEMSLPELAGDYEVYSETVPAGRTISFQFPEDIQSGEGLRFIITGEWTEGEMVGCNLYGPPDTTSIIPPITMLLFSETGFEGRFSATVEPTTDGEFTLVSDPFVHSDDGDFSLLLGVEVVAELICEWALVGGCSISESSFGHLSEVSVQVMGAVPTDSSTWGGVKSLYR